MARKITLRLIYSKLHFRASLCTPILFLARQLSRFLKTGVVFSYNASEIHDGTGAQAQRILSIRALAEYLDLGYLHSEIRQVSVHPLDPHQNEKDYFAFLKNINRQFAFSSDISQMDAKTYPKLYISKLDFQTLLKLIIRFRNGRRCIAYISECYPVIDSMPRIYSLATSLILNRFALPVQEMENASKVIAVHYRSVPKKYAVYVGEKRTRQLKPERVVNLINSIIDIENDSQFQVKIFTDAPPNNLKLPVFAKQGHLWQNTPGYQDGYFELEGSDIYEIFKQINAQVEYIVGGDPIEAIIGMVNSDILITSKSSLSFVAALLFIGEKVFIPYEFWHTSYNASRY